MAEEMKDVAAGLLEGMAQKSGAAVRNDGDYIGEGGMLHCGVCHQRKERMIEFPVSMSRDGKSFSMRVRCMCKCESDEQEEQMRREQEREEMQRIERLRSSSLIESKLKGARLATFIRNEGNQKLYTVAERYVENFEDMYKKSQGILFYGPVGTGKSYTAACIANELLDRKIPVVMTSFVKILQVVQGGGMDESEYIGRLNAARLLIIDDLGTERNTEYALEKVYNVIDSRYLTGKPLILTTNLSLRDMQEADDTRYKRIYDRIFEMCYPFQVKGDSWRLGQAAQRFEDMRKMLEG